MSQTVLVVTHPIFFEISILGSWDRLFYWKTDPYKIMNIIQFPVTPWNSDKCFVSDEFSSSTISYTKIISNELFQSWPLKCVKNMEFRGQIFVVSGIFLTLEVKQCIAMHLQRITFFISYRLLHSCNLI